MFSDPNVRNWVSTLAGAGVACGAALADAFHFHTFGTGVDLVVLMGGLGALGLHATASVASNLALTPPPGLSK